MSKTDQNSIIGLFEAQSLLLRVNLRSAVTSDYPDPTVVDVANWWWTISNVWCMGRPWPGPAVLCSAGSQELVNQFISPEDGAGCIYSAPGGCRPAHSGEYPHPVSVSSPVLRWSSVTRTALSLWIQRVILSVERWPVRAAASQHGCLSAVWSVAGGEWW